MIFLHFRFISDFVSIGVEFLQNFVINWVKCYCLILSTESIKGNFRSFTVIPEVHFLYSHYLSCSILRISASFDVTTSSNCKMNVNGVNKERNQCNRCYAQLSLNTKFINDKCPKVYNPRSDTDQFFSTLSFSTP